MVRSRGLGLIRSIVSLTLVFDICDVSRVSISYRVGDNLGTTIRKGNTVFTRGSITITVLILSKVGPRVVISDSITILVDSWAIISGLMVRRSRVSRLVGRSWVGNHSRFVDNRGRFVGRGRGRVVDGSRFVGRGWVEDGSMGMVDSMGKGMVGNGVGKVGSMVDGMGEVSVGRGVDGVMARGMDTSSIFLLIVVLVNLIGSGGGLGMDSCMVSTMGFVD